MRNEYIPGPGDYAYPAEWISTETMGGSHDIARDWSL